MKPQGLTPANAWRLYWEEGKSLSECAEVFGVSVGTMVSRFHDWTFPTRPKGPRKGVAGIRAKLSEEEIRYILSSKGKKSLRVLSDELGVSRERVRQIQAGQHRQLPV